jgi:hypothetical protein
MPVITDVASAQVKRGVRKLYGTVLTQPALLVSDGIEMVWACDVDIAATDPLGRTRQFGNEGQKDPGTGDDDDDKLEGLPGQDSFDLDASLMIDTTLHNVIIARNNADLIYAEVGNAVTVERTASGQWQVTGFSIEKPGTYHIIPVDLGNMTIGTVVDMSIDGHLLSLGELGTLSPFGVIPFGSGGLFRGGKLLRIA